MSEKYTVVQNIDPDDPEFGCFDVFVGNVVPTDGLEKSVALVYFHRSNADVYLQLTPEVSLLFRAIYRSSTEDYGPNIIPELMSQYLDWAFEIIRKNRNTHKRHPTPPYITKTNFYIPKDNEGTVHQLMNIILGEKYLKFFPKDFIDRQTGRITIPLFFAKWFIIYAFNSLKPDSLD